MTSYITLYAKCAITPEKNFKVDDIENYLTSITDIYTITTQMQYFKNELKVNCDVNFDQTNIDIEIQSNNFNYAKVTTGLTAQTQGNTHYYFIKNKKWLSSNCLRLELEMDTLNTLKTLVSISSKSMILREHKNRWKGAGEQGLYLPLIDFYPEGINPPLFKTDETTMFEYDALKDYTDDNSYYLVYRSESDSTNSPIHILLYTDHQIHVNIITTYGWTGNYVFNEHQIGGDGGLYGVIYGADEHNGHNNVGVTFDFKFWDRTTKSYRDEQSEISATNQVIIFGDKKIVFGTTDSNGFHQVGIRQYGILDRHMFSEAFINGVYAIRRIAFGSHNASYWTPTHILDGSLDTSIYNDLDYYIPDIASIDRTDPLLLKIVKLPYCPITLKYDNNGDLIYLPSGWEVVAPTQDFPACLRYLYGDLTKALSRRFSFISDSETYENPYAVLQYEEQTNRGKQILRNNNYETKLYNSEFFIQKFVYDSFSFEFKAEHMETDGSPQALFVDFSVSLTMSSKFMFQFPFTSYGYGLKLDNQDYSSLMYVARNNELPIFNSDYLNYIRSGYNYDIKTRNRQLASSIVLGVLSTAGAIGSAMTGNAVGVVGAIALGTSALSNLSRVAFNTAQADQNIAQKLRSAELQGVSVAGADDVDLMTIYTNDNKAKLVKYEVSERMKKVLGDLFHYCGYVAGYQGVPNETSRKVFNFVQADILFNVMQYNVPSDLMDDYKKKYHDGVTIIHHYTLKDANNQNVRGWDFEQQYENWETTIS